MHKALNVGMSLGGSVKKSWDKVASKQEKEAMDFVSSFLRIIPVAEG